MDKQPVYITTAIAYANANPHLGHAFEFIQTDALARQYRALGHPVWFVTGMDEHGTKIAKAAADAGMETQRFVDVITDKFRSLDESLHVSPDDFVRTTSDSHQRAAKKFWQASMNNGDIYKKQYIGLYCVGCETFYLEKDLDNGKCPIHLNEPITVEEENYFFRLSKYQKELEKFFNEHPDFIIPTGRQNEMKQLLKEGLEDISISRSVKQLSWGVPVPDDPNQVMYVWFDALTNYISIIGYDETGDRDPMAFGQWWGKETKIIHCIGKDIIRFHALLWPAMLMSVGLRLPDQLFVHGFLLCDGHKMSKSLGNTIDPVDLIARYGADGARYVLLREVPATEDADLTWKKMDERHTADLANGLGNLLGRVTTLAEQHGFVDVDRASEWQQTKKEVEKLTISCQFHLALQRLWEEIAKANQMIDHVAPWKLVKEDKEAGRKFLGELVGDLRQLAEVLHPFMPETADKIKQAVGGERIAKAAILFPRISS
ncbi:MAG: methionine--tRNA ligase [bacterium]